MVIFEIFFTEKFPIYLKYDDGSKCHVILCNRRNNKKLRVTILFLILKFCIVHFFSSLKTVNAVVVMFCLVVVLLKLILGSILILFLLTVLLCLGLKSKTNYLIEKPLFSDIKVYFCVLLMSIFFKSQHFLIILFFRCIFRFLRMSHRMDTL